MKRLFFLTSSFLIFFSQICFGYEHTNDLALKIKKEKLFFNDMYTAYVIELKNISDDSITIESIKIDNAITKDDIKNEYDSTEKASELCLSMIGFGIGEEPSKSPVIFAPVGIISLPFALVYDGIKKISISSTAKKYSFTTPKSILLKKGKIIEFSSIKETNSSDNLLIKISYKINKHEKSTVLYL